MPSRRLLAVAASALVALLALGLLAGYRWDPARAVPAPPDDASAAEVTLTYLAAFNHRDFRTVTTLYPSSSGYSRVRPMGRYDDVQTTRLLAEGADGGVRVVPTERGQTLVWVMVRYTAVGFADSDRAVQDGPGGTGFKLSRDDLRHPWRIIDSGSP